LPGNDLCFRRDLTEDNTFVGLSVKYDGPLRGSHHYGNHSEVFLTIDNDCNWRVCNRFVDGFDQALGQCSRWIFHPDATACQRWLPVTGSPHCETIDDGYIRYDSFFLEIVGYNISDGIDDLTCQKREYLIDIPVQVAKRFLEELPVLFGQGKHQRTFSA